MEQLDYKAIEEATKELKEEKIAINNLKEYNLKQNYSNAVLRLCNSDILEDWKNLNKITNFDAVKTGEYYDKKQSHWVQFIDKYITRDGKITDNYDNLKLSFNPQTTWIRVNGGFGVYRSWGSCGDTNMLYFKPEDVDIEKVEINWHEFKGTKENEVNTKDSWFGDALVLKAEAIKILLENYERYRTYTYNTTLRVIKENKAAMELERKKAEDLLEKVEQ